MSTIKEDPERLLQRLPEEAQSGVSPEGIAFSLAIERVLADAHGRRSARDRDEVSQVRRDATGQP